MWLDYLVRRGTITHHDEVMAFQEQALADMLVRLEIVLADEDVPPEKITRVLRSLLYSAPTEADALLRMKQQERLYEALTGPVPGFFPRMGDLLPDHGKRS